MKISLLNLLRREVLLHLLWLLVVALLVARVNGVLCGLLRVIAGILLVVHWMHLLVLLVHLKIITNH